VAAQPGKGQVITADLSRLLFDTVRIATLSTVCIGNCTSGSDGYRSVAFGYKLVPVLAGFGNGK
jgi:hypothetical protein